MWDRTSQNWGQVCGTQHAEVFRVILRLSQLAIFKFNGKMFRFWIFRTQSLAYFSIHYSRGAKVLKEVLGETFEGAITSNSYSAYVSYSKGIQQFCLAHLI